MSRVTEATAKRLFAVSGNKCAFPKCPLPLVEPASGKVTGRICHIKARNPSGPRYDQVQTDEERNAFENLILMCPIHHDVIDADEIAYTVDHLTEIKRKYERKWQQQPNEVSDALASALIALSDVRVESGSVLIALNQAGGQIAHTITNIQQPEPQRAAVLEPIIKRDPHTLRPEFTTLDVRLRNIGDAKPRDAKVTLKFPESMNHHSTQDKLRRTADGWVHCEADNRFFNDQQIFDQLYPGDTTRQSIFWIHYYLEPDKALTSTEELHIEIRCGDSPAFITRITFGQLSSLPSNVWYALGPAGADSYSEIVPAVSAA